MTEPEEINRFWIEEIGPKGWYKVDDALDEEIRRRFRADWEEIAGGALPRWPWSARATLARLILADQFPRNMFRGEGRSFATDVLARRWAKWAVEARKDQKVKAPERQFFYLPLMHSEVLADQDRSVRLFLSRMPGGNDNLGHARAHREVIREFGRFPYRNEALGRRSSAKERDYLEAGGYRHTMQQLGVGQG